MELCVMSPRAWPGLADGRGWRVADTDLSMCSRLALSTVGGDTGCKRQPVQNAAAWQG